MQKIKKFTSNSKQGVVKYLIFFKRLKFFGDFTAGNPTREDDHQNITFTSACPFKYETNSSRQLIKLLPMPTGFTHSQTVYTGF